jgi:endonuclease-3
MTKKERYQTAIAYFEEQIPIAETELIYDNPFQLLVAVILSAQCTDKRVNLTTPYIFQKYPDPQSMAQAGFDDLFPLIRSISYPNNKTKHLLGMAAMLLEKFEGEVPMTVEELVQLPGVGRKGLTTNATTPLAAEKQLIKNIPAELVHKAHHWLILHGRYTCLARSPKCEECGLQSICKYYVKASK